MTAAWPGWIRASDRNAPYQNCLVVQTAVRHSKPPPLNTSFFCQKRPLCQPPPSPTPPPNSRFVRKVKLRLAYRLAFVTSKNVSHLHWPWRSHRSRRHLLVWVSPPPSDKHIGKFAAFGSETSNVFGVFATFLVFSNVFHIFVVWLHDRKIHPVSIPSFSETYAFHLLLGHLKQRYCYALRWRNLEGMTPSVLEEFRKQNSRRLPLNCQTGMQIVVHKLYQIILYPQ